MNDPDVTARKIALFDTAVFDQYRHGNLHMTGILSVTLYDIYAVMVLI
jgi:hypothetical protein